MAEPLLSIISSNIMLKKLSIFLIILCLFSCGGNKYYNKKFKYTVTLPANYVIIEDGIPTEQSQAMIDRIAAEGAVPMYQGVDAAFCSTDSFGPVFDSITVAALNKPFSMKQIEQSQFTIEAMFMQMLSSSRGLRHSDRGRHIRRILLLHTKAKTVQPALSCIPITSSTRLCGQ